MSNIIKIYGERNTGSNYLQQLILLNLDADVLSGSAPRRLRRIFGDWEAPRDLYFRLTFPRNLGWKHAVPPDLDKLQSLSLPLDRFLFLTLSKNPYAWLLSLFRRPYHHLTPSADFGEFLQSPWRTLPRENHPRPFANPMQLWNIKNRSYLELAKTALCRNLKYEDLLYDPAAVIAALAADFGIARKQAPFANVAESTKAEAGKGFAYFRDYYLQERWRREWDDKAIAIANEHLDGDLMTAFGYERVRNCTE